MKSISILSIFAFLIVFTSCSKEEETVEETVETGKISTYEEVALKLVDSDSDEYPVAMSTKTGATYKESEITTENIADIDLVSFTFQAFISFMSPDNAEETENVEGVTKTLIMEAGDALTVEQFDAMTDDTLLKDITIVSDEEAQPIDFKGIFLFQNEDGKKGAIKIIYINADRLLFDVKVME